MNSPVDEFLPAPTDDLVVAPLLDLIDKQAADADVSRRIDPAVIDALKSSDVMRLPASREIAGLEAPMLSIGRELEAIAARCPSTAWTQWNHQCVFHLFAGTLGPDHADLLTDLITAGEWGVVPRRRGLGGVRPYRRRRRRPHRSGFVRNRGRLRRLVRGRVRGCR